MEGKRHRARQDHHRGDQGPADPPGPQLPSTTASRRPKPRAPAGKPAEGRLSLRAFHEGGQVNIEIADDGAGIDPDGGPAEGRRARAAHAAEARRAHERARGHEPDLPAGLLDRRRRSPTSPAAASAWTWCKTNIEKIGGTVDVAEPCRAAARPSSIKIPLTLAIIPALIVTSGGDRYAIPQVSLLELVRLEGEQAPAGDRDRSTARRSTGSAATCCRSSTSREQLGVEPAGRTTTTSSTSSCCRPTTGSSGWSSTSINDTEEIVVKPLGQPAARAIDALRRRHDHGRRPGRADPRRAWRWPAGPAWRSDARATPPTARPGASAGSRHARQSLLLVVGVGGRPPRRDPARLGRPARGVRRRDRVERIGGHEVVQYRGEILPLRPPRPRASRGTASRRRATTVQVVVCHAARAARVGLVVERDPRHRRGGALESAATRHRRPPSAPRSSPATSPRSSTSPAPCARVDPAPCSRPRRLTPERAFHDVPVLHLPPRRAPLRRRRRLRAGGPQAAGDDPGPAGAAEVCGLINLRGQIVTALDLRARLGLAPRPAERRR